MELVPDILRGLKKAKRKQENQKKFGEVRVGLYGLHKIY